MKKQLSIFALLILFSCQKTEVEQLAPQTTYYRLLFEFNGEPTEASRILKSVKTSNLRTDGNLVVDGDVTLTSGSFDVIEVKSGSLTIDGQVFVQNLNLINNGKDVTIQVTTAGKFTIGSSLNLNGKVKFYNNGELHTKSVELQNGQNDLVNNGKHWAEGDLQVTSGVSTYQNCGIAEVTNYVNLHSGRYSACNCGTLKSSGLNVNGTDKIEGKGFIEVTGNLNMNGHFTKSPDITLCYAGSVDNVKLGAAKLSCENTCKVPGLPLKYYDLQLINDIISFKITENANLFRMRVQQSLDAKAWKDLKEFHELPKEGLFEIKLGEL